MGGRPRSTVIAPIARQLGHRASHELLERLVKVAVVDQRQVARLREVRDQRIERHLAPVEQPLYAAAVVIEHGLGGSRAAAPVAKDFMTYMFDPQKAMDSLLAMEAGWGGNIQQRMAAEFDLFRARAEGRLPEPPTEEAAD